MRREDMRSTFEEALEVLDGEDLRAVLLELFHDLEEDVSSRVMQSVIDRAARSAQGWSPDAPAPRQVAARDWHAAHDAYEEAASLVDVARAVRLDIPDPEGRQRALLHLICTEYEAAATLLRDAPASGGPETDILGPSSSRSSRACSVEGVFMSRCLAPTRKSSKG